MPFRPNPALTVSGALEHSERALIAFKDGGVQHAQPEDIERILGSGTGGVDSKSLPPILQAADYGARDRGPALPGNVMDTGESNVAPFQSFNRKHHFRLGWF